MDWNDNNFSLTVTDNMIREFSANLSLICIMPQGLQKETQKNLKEFFRRTDFQRFINLVGDRVLERGHGRMVQSSAKVEHKVMLN